MLNAEQQALVLRYQRFPIAIARDLRLRGDLREETIAEGYRALCLAALRFDPLRGAPSTYLYRCVRGEMMTFVRRKRPLTVSLSDHYAARGEPCPVDQAERIAALLAPLTPREREMVTRIAEGETAAEVGRSMGVGRSRAQQIRAEAARKVMDSCKKSMELP